MISRYPPRELEKKIKHVIDLINNYSDKRHSLSRLKEYVEVLRELLNQKSENDVFNQYIKKVLLPGFDYYVKKFRRTDRILKQRSF